MLHGLNVALAYSCFQIYVMAVFLFLFFFFFPVLDPLNSTLAGKPCCTAVGVFLTSGRVTAV